MDFGDDEDSSSSRDSSSEMTEMNSSPSDYLDTSTGESYDIDESESSGDDSSLVDNILFTEDLVEDPQPSTSGLQTLAPHPPVIQDEDINELSEPSIVPGSSIEVAGSKTVPKEPNEVANTQGSDEDGLVCPICFEAWDNSGLHRLVNLKCGHLFGQSCIEKWLKGNGQRCPQCNLKSRKADIRNVYATTLKVRDTTERDQTMRELEKEKATRLKLEVDLLQTKAKYSKAQAELEQLKEQLKKEIQNKSQVAGPVHQRNASKHVSSANAQKLILEKSIVVSKNGNCRVAAFLEFLNMTVVSKPNSNPIFPGFGLSKIDTSDFRQHEFIPIHEKPIRDVCFGSDLNGLVLTASMDKTVKLTNVLSNATVLSYSTEAPVWSCVWSKRNSFHVFAGLQNGSVVLYDTRQTTRQLSKFKSTSTSPVVSLQHVDVAPASALSTSGILVGQLDRCLFFELGAPDPNKVHFLPVQGPITSVSFEPASRHFMVSCRPNQQNKHTRHMVYEMSQHPPDDNIRCNLIETFYGGDTQRLLGKGRLLCNPTNEESMLACGADESSNSALIWDVSNGNQLQRLQANSPVLDICPTKSQEKHYICTLTDKSLNVFRWQ